MPLLSHELEQEFPALKNEIREWRGVDGHFARLCENYRNLDEDISRIEENGEPVSDFELEDMKKRRLALKDEIYAFLRSHRH